MEHKSTEEYLKEIVEHKKNVGEQLNKVISELFKRGINHDFSKLDEIEMEGFKTIFPIRHKTKYYSEEYKQALASIQPSIQNHYKNNPHHPEYYENGINDMTLIDIIEMLCDWLGAMKDTTKFMESLHINKQRFKIDDQLFGILVNTILFMENSTKNPSKN